MSLILAKAATIDVPALAAIKIVFGGEIRRVRIDIRRQIDLWLGNMQETVGLAGRQGARLFGIQDIVGRRRDFGGALRRRPQRGKGLNQMWLGGIIHGQAS